MIPLFTTVATRYFAFVTWGLILANTLVFLAESALPPASREAFITHYALTPQILFSAPHQPGLESLVASYSAVFTNFFLHGGFWHLLTNMWMLYIFGPAVEDRLGSTRFLAFFLACGVAASLAHAFVNSTSNIPVLGASGAVAGVMGAYMRLFPLSKMLVLVPVFIFPFFFEMYAVVFVGIWFLIQVISGIGGLLTGVGTLTGGIAWWAHIGGFFVGFLALDLLRLRPELYRDFQRDEGVNGFLPDGRRTGKGPWR